MRRVFYNLVTNAKMKVAFMSCRSFCKQVQQITAPVSAAKLIKAYLRKKWISSVLCITLILCHSLLLAGSGALLHSLLWVDCTLCMLAFELCDLTVQLISGDLGRFLS